MYCKDKPKVGDFSFQLLLSSHVLILMLSDHSCYTSSAAFVYGELLLVSMELSGQLFDSLLKMFPACLRSYKSLASLRKLFGLYHSLALSGPRDAWQG